MMNDNNQSTYRGFTDSEWIAIDNAFEALLTEVETTEDPEFSIALEKVVSTFNLCEHMTKEVKDQWAELAKEEYYEYYCTHDADDEPYLKN